MNEDDTEDDEKKRAELKYSYRLCRAKPLEQRKTWFHRATPREQVPPIVLDFGMPSDVVYGQFASASPALSVEFRTCTAPVELLLIVVLYFFMALALPSCFGWKAPRMFVALRACSFAVGLGGVGVGVTTGAWGAARVDLTNTVACARGGCGTRLLGFGGRGAARARWRRGTAGSTSGCTVVWVIKECMREKEAIVIW